MIFLIALGLISSAAVSATLLLLFKRKAPYPVFSAAAAFLVAQAAYLCLLVLDNGPGSEAWIFLALTYIPLAIALFLLITTLSIATALRTKETRERLKAFSAIPIHGLLSYVILDVWGTIFKLPL
jgi:uncharacterized membrane protein YhhN